MAPLLSFLVRPKKNVIAEVDAFMEKFRGKRVIGVQMRTTETYADEELLTIYGECVDLVSDEYDVIFVSTDSTSARNMLIERFGSRVVFYDDNIDMSHVRKRHILKVSLEDHFEFQMITLQSNISAGSREVQDNCFPWAQGHVDPCEMS